MKLWTTQMAKWRTAKERNIVFIDTTVKSGDKVFAPTWEIVMSVKSGQISEDTYTQEYLRLMRASYRTHLDRWLEVCQMDEVAIACYCTHGKFCHRHLLADMLSHVCTRYAIPFQLQGELGV